MDNRNKKNRSIFERRGFYVALYSCIGVVLVLAVGLTYNTMNRGRSDTISRQARLDSQSLTEAPRGPVVSGNMTENDILSAADAARAAAPATDYQNGQAAENAAPSTGAQAETQPPATAAPDTQTTPPAQTSQNDVIDPAESIPVSMALSQSLTDVAGRENREEPASEEAPPPTSQLSADWDDDPVAYEPILADPVFSIFTGTEDMLWPVNGEIVMDFSTDRLIHDVTLNQFRTNDKISISATVGTQVRASSDGVVRSIVNDRRLGNTVTLEHGNGWFTTYSQLQEHILVEEGDVVNQGQVIGGVGEPSIFYTLLGSHLSFGVTRNDMPVNPLVVLADN